jgi:hypothetical protein
MSKNAEASSARVQGDGPTGGASGASREPNARPPRPSKREEVER